MKTSMMDLSRDFLPEIKFLPLPLDMQYLKW